MMITLMSLLVMQPADASAEIKDAKEEMVCKRIREEARRTGSNLRRPARSKKVCRTATEWAQIEQAKEEMFRGINENQGAGSTNQGSTIGG